MSDYLETDRLVLRHLTADGGADLLNELDSDPAVMRHLTGGAPSPRVWGDTTVVNVASQRVVEKAGMSVVEQLPTPEGMQALEGSERGGLRYAITREQWQSA